MSHHTLAMFLVLAIAQLFVIHQAEGVVAVKGVCDLAAAAGEALACDADASLTCEIATCKVKIGGTCSASSTDECVTGAAACPDTGTLECACPDNYTPNSDNTGCSGAAGVMTSLVLLVASFLTSRMM